MTNFRSIIVLVAGAAVALGATVASAAVELGYVPQIVVHIKTSDLNSEEGIQKVYAQIKVAAENACPAITTGTLLSSQKTQACREAAIARAVESIHNKRLAEWASASKTSG
jgi:UrcA family protein